MDTLFFASSFCWPLRPETKQNPFSLYSHKLHVQHIGFYGAGNPQSSHIRAQLNHSRISRQETPAANHAATCEDLCTSVIGLCDTVVGVLGGGQLGRMLCQTASKMGVKVAVLDPLENCPASALAYKHVVGSFRDTNAVQEFAKGCGVLTVEIEHVDVETLEMLEEQGVDCQPNSSTIRLIQGNNRILRWSLWLDGLDFEIQYKPGKDNCIADLLTREAAPTKDKIKAIQWLHPP